MKLGSMLVLGTGRVGSCKRIQDNPFKDNHVVMMQAKRKLLIMIEFCCRCRYLGIKRLCACMCVCERELCACVVLSCA